MKLISWNLIFNSKLNNYNNKIKLIIEDNDIKTKIIFV